MINFIAHFSKLLYEEITGKEGYLSMNTEMCKEMKKNDENKTNFYCPQNNQDTIKRLIEEGANIKYISPVTGNNGLHEACYRGFLNTEYGAKNLKLQ